MCSRNASSKLPTENLIRFQEIHCRLHHCTVVAPRVSTQPYLTALANGCWQGLQQRQTAHKNLKQHAERRLLISLDLFSGSFWCPVFAVWPVEIVGLNLLGSRSIVERRNQLLRCLQTTKVGHNMGHPWFLYLTIELHILVIVDSHRCCRNPGIFIETNDVK